MEFTHEKGDTYLLIGRDCSGRKFRMVYDNPYFALGINMYRGRMWQVRNGKRKLVKSVFN